MEVPLVSRSSPKRDEVGVSKLQNTVLMIIGDCVVDKMLCYY